jgi:hypothetical protein
MGHFETEEWIDFVRKLGETEKRTAMEEHLISGCEECHATQEFWARVTNEILREASYEPPDRLAQTAKALWSLRQMPAALSTFVVLAELVRDSFRMPAPAGVRSAGLAPQSLLYRAGQVHIALSVEEVSGQLSIVGQVIDMSRPNEEVADAQVTVVGAATGERKAATTNEFGEFHLQFEPAGHVYIAVKVTHEKEILVPLDPACANPASRK